MPWQVCEAMLKMRAAMSKIYHYQFQVLPYMYVHLVSSLAGLFLLVYTFEKALLFRPEASVFCEAHPPHGQAMRTHALVMSSSSSSSPPLLHLLPLHSPSSDPLPNLVDGFAIPFCSWLLMVGSCYGLIEVGTTNPLQPTIAQANRHLRSFCCPAAARASSVRRLRPSRLLAQVGTTIANPVGAEPEDFAIYSFCKVSTQHVT